MYKIRIRQAILHALNLEEEEVKRFSELLYQSPVSSPPKSRRR